MTLVAGARIGPYEVVAPLGAGGMGEVYRARDPRLRREVAIKVLPASFASDADALRRFEHEARAIGALSHPNLLSVHDVGQQDGAPYLVAELLEGTTLRERLTEGPPPLRTVIDWSMQIASGLAAAHAKGVVHRDLKPENLFVTRDGRVKILDFGLAKLRVPVSAEELSKEATATGTSPGVVLGTLPYMSPEQARGRPTDARSDIFSLGAVLYELLAGRRAFKGETPADTLTAILSQDPLEISKLRSEVPPVLERIVARCLEKEPERRFHSAHDLGIALETLSGVPTSPVARPEAGRGRRPAWLRTAGLLTAIVAAAVAGMLAGRTTAPHAIPSYQLLTFRRGNVTGARFARDGQTIVYSAAWDGGPSEIYSRRTENPESSSLGLPPAMLLSVSSKDELAILLTKDRNPANSLGTLARVPLVGGTPKELLQKVQDADWAPDGERLCVLRVSPESPGLRRIEFPIGKVLVEGDVFWPRVSPKGDRVAFLGEGVEVVDLSGRRSILTAKPPFMFGLAWSPSGDEVLLTAGEKASDRSLYAVTLAGKQRLLARVAGSLSVYDAAADGRVLSSFGYGRHGIAALPPGESRERELTVFNRSWLQGLSPDGAIALVQDDTFDRPLVYVRRTDGSPPLRLGEGRALALSPDGGHVLIQTLDGRTIEQPTGAGEPKPVELGGIEPISASWAGDGRSLFLIGREHGRKIRIFVREGESGRWRGVTAEGVAGPFVVAPEGRAVALQGPSGVAIYPTAGGEPRTYGVARGEPVHWSASGQTLYVHRSRQSAPAVIEELDLATGTLRPFRELMPFDPTGVSFITPVHFARDGRSYAYSYSRQLADLYLIDGVR